MIEEEGELKKLRGDIQNISLFMTEEGPFIVRDSSNVLIPEIARNRQMLMDMANAVPMNPLNPAQVQPLALPPPAPVQQPVVPIVLQHGYKQPAIMMDAADSMEGADRYDRMQKYRT